MSLRAGTLLAGTLVLAWLGLGCQSEQTPSESPDTCTLTAASNMLHPPFSSWDEQRTAVGIEVEIVNAAASEIGCRVEWVERPFSELLTAIEDGSIDIAVSTLGVTAEREQRVAFSQRYFTTQIVALVRPDSAITSLEELAEAKIGADQATTSFSAAQGHWPNAELVGSVTDEMTWPQMVEQGVVDAFVVDASDQSRLERVSNISLRRLEQPLTAEHFGIAMHKDATDVLAAMNRAVEEILPAVPLWIGGEHQFTTPLGIEVASLRSPDAKLVADYNVAKARYEQNPDDADAIIWLGRRAGYLFRFNEAIQIFGEGIEKHPRDARMYRHRGHRYITTRQFENAINDFETAVELIAGTEDIVEPDGAPNAQGVRLTTLQGNIWYHLGLAHYLNNDLENALKAYRKREHAHRYDDNIVSNGHWLYMILRRLGNEAEAAAVVAGVSQDMNIIENSSYHRMCLFYKGDLSTADLLPETDEQRMDDVVWYSLGNWQLYDRGNEAKAREYFEELLDQGRRNSFAYIAAESDYLRLFRR